MEKALGIQWNTDKKTFGSKIAAKGGFFTYREFFSFLSPVHNAIGLVASFILGRKFVQRLSK